MPSDVNPRNIEKTAIPINYITERLRRCGADNVILLLDACRSDGDRNGEGIGTETQQGIVTLFSCSPSEQSYEIDELQHEAFTHTLRVNRDESWALLNSNMISSKSDRAFKPLSDRFISSFSNAESWSDDPSVCRSAYWYQAETDNYDAARDWVKLS